MLNVPSSEGMRGISEQVASLLFGRHDEVVPNLPPFRDLLIEKKNSHDSVPTSFKSSCCWLPAE